MATIRKILCPTDFSDNSRPALATACEWAKQFNAELHLLHVVGGLSTPYPYLGPPFNETAPFETMIRQKARTALDKWPLSAGYEALNVVRSLRTGSPIANILEYAKETGTNLIVMGTHGRTGIGHVRFGSVAENVVRRAPCSVLTVHPAPNAPSAT